MNKPFLCATAARVDPETRIVEVTLENGQIYRCSLADISERLRLVSSSLLMDWEWIGPQAGMHWPSIDEDLSIEHLISNGTLLSRPSKRNKASVKS